MRLCLDRRVARHRWHWQLEDTMTDLSQRGGIAVLHQGVTLEVVKGVPSAALRYGVIFVSVFAFTLYWLSSLLLLAHNAGTYFGADSNVYGWIAYGNIEDRLTRFHPITSAMALTWMGAFKEFTAWIAPAYILQAMFAMVGAAGVWAAMIAFSSVMPRPYVWLWGLIYAVSFGAWYFSSIPESKIVTASLVSIYIALYMQLREQWTFRGAVVLTAILAVACLNEIVSAFLVIIPAVETLLSRDWTWRKGRWIVAHGLVAPIALIILEVIVEGFVIAPVPNAEGGSHLSMLLFYISINDHSAASLYGFLLNWIFFNIAAPAQDALYAVPLWPNYRAYFDPALGAYLLRPTSLILVVVFSVMMLTGMLFRQRNQTVQNADRIMLALAAYTLARGAFFFIFNPPEALLFSPAVTLAHLLILAIFFMGSSFPAKRAILLVFAVLLFLTNYAFILHANTGSVVIQSPATPQGQM